MLVWNSPAAIVAETNPQTRRIDDQDIIIQRLKQLEGIYSWTWENIPALAIADAVSELNRSGNYMYVFIVGIVENFDPLFAQTEVHE